MNRYSACRFGDTAYILLTTINCNCHVKDQFLASLSLLGRSGRGVQWTPACTGKEGLFRLLKKAHHSYSEEVTTRLKSYRKFVSDFINSTLYHDDKDAWSRNEHRKNHCIVSGLLNDHEKLVREFFDCESMDEPRLAELLKAFYSSDLPRCRNSARPDAETSGHGPTEPGRGPEFLLDRETVNLIARLANEVNLSKGTLDVEETVRAYERHEIRPIVSACNARLALVLDRLAAHNIIPYNWQTLIERAQVVISSTGRRFLTGHDLASALNRKKDPLISSDNSAVLSVVDSYIKLIKDSQVK